MSDTSKSDDVTLDPETLERLRDELLARSEHESMRVSVPEFRALLNAHERLPQVVAERDRALEQARYLRHAAEAEASALDEVQAANRRKRDALRAKLDKVREIAGRSYFSAECRAAMNEALEVLGDS